MTAEEIFSRMKAHALEGMVFHDEMVRYFDFLNLCGLRDCHEMHYDDESKGYRELCEYYMNHYNKLLPHQPMQRPDVIPDSWYGYSRADVDTGTKTSAVKTAIRKWVDWEHETKDLYESMYAELLNENEIASAEFVLKYVEDVTNELAEVTRLHIDLSSVGYDISFILSTQQESL